jgi:adenylosuccinate lyase
VIGRYETAAMRAIWDAEATFGRWTQVEVAACRAWHARKEISDADMQAIEQRAHHQSAMRVRQIEQETHHDVVAYVRAVAESIGEAGRHIHRGLTSSDVVDTALAMALRDSFEVLLQSTQTLQKTVAERAMQHRDLLCVGRTHGIHAEPTTFGLRLAGWVTELQRHQVRLRHACTGIAFGKLSGAVGTFSQTDPEFEAHVLAQLRLQPEPIATQVVPRDRHAEAFAALANLAAGIERFATEVRHLQRTDVREVEEGFAPGQTGSSAMPHKRNPITCERLCGMARLLRGYSTASLENVALWHDRDISHSSVERVICPDAFHLVHYMVEQFTQVMQRLVVYPDAMAQNLHKTRGLVFSQNVLAALLAQGLERQAAYRIVQGCAMQVWEQPGATFESVLAAHPEVQEHLGANKLAAAFDPRAYTRHIAALFARAGLS